MVKDPGTFYTHSNKKELHLTDIFIQPTLRRRRVDTAEKYVDSVDSMKFLREAKRAAIVGEEGSGKTALAKMLYRHYLSDSAVVPIYVSGEEFDSVGEKQLGRSCVGCSRRSTARERLNGTCNCPPMLGQLSSTTFIRCASMIVVEPVLCAS